MNAIDTFIILYLIFGFLLSLLISFFFLKKYRKTKDIISKPKVLAGVYYYCIINFSLVIFYILIVILDHTIFTFEDFSVYEGTIVIHFTIFLPYFYMLFSYYALISKFIIIPVLNLYNTTTYYNGCDIILDILIRFLSIYFNKLYLIIAIIAFGIIGFAVIVDQTIYSYHDWILEKTEIDSFISFIGFLKFLLNYLNFYSYIKILFYIGFCIQNIIRVDSIKRNQSENENFYIWSLGKIFIYYIQETEAIIFGYNEVKKKYEEFNTENNNIDNNLENKWEKFKTDIEKIINNKIIQAELDNVEYATKTYKEKFEDENNKVKIAKDDFKTIDKRIEAIKKTYTNELFAKKVCCLCCKKIKSDYEKFKEDICDTMIKVYEESMKLLRKNKLIEKIGNKLLNLKDYNINCCRSLKCIKCLWILFLIFLIILELPINWQITSSYSLENFLIILSFYSILSVYFFSIFIYSIINHKYIQGELVFGKNLSEVNNFLNFILVVFSLFNASIYHSLWIVNKKGNIRAEYYNIFYLPKNDIELIKSNNSILTSNIASLGNLALIIIFIFIASKYTELKICNKVLFVFNENTEFFFSEYDFYLYFIIGCACYINIKKNPKKFYYGEKEFLIDNEKKPLLNEDIIEP